MITIRNAAMEDAGTLLEIYGHYVRSTAISFEYEVPSEVEFRRRMENTMQHYPYLVAEQDGQIQGYAYAGAFNARAAYDWCCETTIYLRRDARKHGMGRMLYDALEEALGEMGMLNLYALVAVPEEDDEYLSTNSRDFHLHLGFREVGVYRRCGYKFGRWYNMACMEKIIGEHEAGQRAVVPYPMLTEK